MKVIAAIACVTAVMALPLAPSGQATATSIVVTSLTDDGSAGTLRDAISVANATAGADVITFDPALAGTITLTSALPKVTESLTITGPGQNVLTIDGAGQHRVFDTSGVAGITLSLSDMTLRNGQRVNGGLLYNNRNTVIVTDVTFRDQADGSAVFNLDGGSHLSFTRSTFADSSTGIGADHGSTPDLPVAATSWVTHNDDSAFTNTTTIVDSTFVGNGFGISTERYTKILNSTFANNFYGASINGLNRSQVIGSTFSANTIGIRHFSWMPPTMNFGTDNRYIHDNLFLGSSVAIILGDSLNTNVRTQDRATITNNRWDENGIWIQWERHDGQINLFENETTLDRVGVEFTASGNRYLERLNAPAAPTVSAGVAQVRLNWTAPASTGANTAVESYTVAWSSDGFTTSTSASVVGTSHTVTGLIPGTAYDFMVRAVNTTAGVVSGWSVASTATPTAPPPVIILPPPPSTDPVPSDAAVSESAGPETTARQVVRSIDPVARTVSTSVGGAAVTFTAPEGGRVDAEGRLTVNLPAQVRVTGQGMAPGEEATVWIMSTPQLLGTMTVAADGSFDATFTIPMSMEVGDHTVRIDTLAADGEPFSVAVAVTLAASQLPTAGGHTQVSADLVVLILALGAVLVLISRRRHDSEAFSAHPWERP